MAQLNPYLQFDGNCKEAMNFYKDSLGGELTIQTVGESPMAGQMGPNMDSRVLHSSLTNGKLVLFAADMIGPEGAVKSDAVNLCLVCSNKEEIERLFANLSRGGNVTHPLKEEFFGTFGDLTDKYGFNWMLQLDMPKP